VEVDERRGNGEWGGGGDERWMWVMNDRGIEVDEGGWNGEDGQAVHVGHCDGRARVAASDVVDIELGRGRYVL
jgi:hypothetical protein